MKRRMIAPLLLMACATRHLPEPTRHHSISDDAEWSWEIPVSNDLVEDLVGQSALDECRKELTEGRAYSCSWPIPNAPCMTLIVWGSRRPSAIMISECALDEDLPGGPRLPGEWKYFTLEDAEGARRVMGSLNSDSFDDVGRHPIAP
jgi:hypothetical protein